MSTSDLIEGIVSAMVTPFNPDEGINDAGLSTHVDRLIEAGVTGVFSGGTNGEFYAMTPQERITAISITVD